MPQNPNKVSLASNASRLGALSLVGTLMLLVSGVVAARDEAASDPKNNRSELRPQTSDGHALMKGTRNAYTVIPSRFADRAPQAPTATFIVTYNGFSSQARTAFQYAIDQWASFISSPVPIRVQANWVSLQPGQLGSAGSNGVERNFLGAPEDNTWYPQALADRLAGADVSPGEFDIIANFNKDESDWFFGTNGNTPAGKFDFVTVVMHELAHGLGYAGTMRWDDGDGGIAECNGNAGQGCFGTGNPVSPNIFDRFTENGSGKGLITYGNPSAALGNQLISDNLFYDSANAKDKNGGQRPKLYAPNPFENGSSYSHVDEDVFGPGDPDSLMTPRLDPAESIHDPGDIALCMFEDHGWETSADCVDGPAQGPEVLYNQQLGCAGFAAPAFFWTNGNWNVEPADDFVVPAGQNWSIDTIVVRGAWSTGGGPINGARVSIYRDGSSPSNTKECNYNSIVPTTGTSDQNFEIDLPSTCELGPGTYWLSVRGVMNSANGAWFWVESPSENGDEYEFRDEGDIYGTGCTSWTPHSQCTNIGGPANDLCFGLLGDDGLSNLIFGASFEGDNFLEWTANIP